MTTEAGQTSAGDTTTGDFEFEQKRYLEGFVAGVQIARTAKSLTGAGAPAATAEPIGPDAAARKAQDRVLAAGGKLSDPEKFKREEHPFDTYERLKAHAAKGEYPKPPDNFRWRYFGLFYVAPNQNSYMCRLRLPNGILKATQLAGLADLAERYGGGYSHVTTRANIQIREIRAAEAVNMIEAVQDLGLCSRGSGADNIRNVTGTATAGIDPQELIDTRPFAREWHFHILNDRSLYGLPRKFNVAFDGAGVIPVLEDTNDIGFQAVQVNDGFGLSPGIWFKLCLGGLTGHKSFAGDTGVLVKPGDATMVADAVVRVFIETGDRTDRTKARLKYVLDKIGVDKFLGLMEEKLGRKLDRAIPGALAPRPVFDRTAHIGVHAQKQDCLHWIGIVVPVGRLTVAQMNGIAAISQEFGDGDIRLTVWQNLLISGVPTDKLEGAQAKLKALGLATETNANSGGADRLHRQYRVQIRCLRYQASRRGDRALVRDACGTRQAGEHPSHRLSSFLCAAFRIRNRAARLQGSANRGGRSSRGLPHINWRRIRAGCGPRPGTLSRCCRRGCAAHGRTHSQGLSRASRLQRRNLHRFCAPARTRCAQGHD